MIRLILAVLRLGYLPKIGTPYYYANEGPYGATLTPLEAEGGYVRYQVERGGITVFNSTSFSTWALMCKERTK